MAALRELALILGVEVDDEQMKDADKSFKEFTEDAAKYGALVVTALSTAFGAVVEFGRRTAVEINANAQQLGISRQEYQQWAAVAEAAGVEGEKIVDVMANIQEKARDAALDPRGQMARTFRELGIAARDANGHIKSGPQLMREAANALARMGPGTEQTATAMQLFGDAGRELLPVLGQGSAAIDRAIASFDELGGGLDDEAIESSLEFNRALIQLKTTLMGALSPILSSINPILARMAEALTAVTAKLRLLAERTTALRTAMIALISGGIVALGAAIYANLPAIIAWVIAWAPFIAGVLVATAAVAAFALMMDDLATWFEGGESVIGLWTEALFGVADGREALNKINEGVLIARNAFEQARQRVVKFRDDVLDAVASGERFAQRMVEKLDPVVAVITRIRDRTMEMIDRLREAGELLGIIDVQPETNAGPGGAFAGTQPAQTAPSPGVIAALPTQDRIAAQASGAAVAFGTVTLPASSPRATSNTLQSQHTTQLNINGVIDPRILEPVVERVMRENAERQAADIADAVQGGA